LRRWLQPMKGWGNMSQKSPYPLSPLIGLDRPLLPWVIVGGESGAMSTRGGPERALVERCPPHATGCATTIDPFAACGCCNGRGWRPKPQALEWVRDIRDALVAAGVPFFFKQWGGRTPKTGGRLLDGRTWDEMP